MEGSKGRGEAGGGGELQIDQEAVVERGWAA